MKKYNLTFLLVVLLSMTSYKSFAYITVANDDGVNIRYDYINNGTELEVVDMRYLQNTHPWFQEFINIPETVTFQGRDRKVTSIGDKAFEKCNVSLSIPSSVTHIGKDAFNECKIKSLVINDLAKWCNIEFENLPKWSVEHLLDINYQEVTYLNIPDGVTAINPYVFYTFTGLKGLNIPNTVKTIGDYAFGRCSQMENFIIPNSVTYIGKAAFCALSCWIITIPGSVETIDENAFVNCNFLYNVTFSNGIKTIGKFAFNGCRLSKIEIPASVTSIGTMAFYGSDPTSITVDENNPIYYSRGNAIIETATNTLIEGCSTTNIPYTVTAIGDYAFSCPLSSITIPNSITHISAYAFCKDVAKVVSEIQEPFPAGGAFTQNTYFNSTLIVPKGTISKYRETWGWNQFTYIEQSEYGEVDGIYYKFNSSTECEVAHRDYYSGDIIIPETVSVDDKEYKVTSIGKEAFRSCYQLKTIELPNSIIEIGEGAFSYSGIESVNLPHNLRILGPGSFLECDELKEIVIPETIERICAHTFHYCSKLRTIIIPNEVTSIGDGAFNGCYLKTVVLGEKVNSIGNAAFGQWGDIENIYTLNRTPPTLNVVDNDYTITWTSDIKTTFKDYSYKTSTLWVPESSLDEYKNHSYWGKFVNIQTFNPNTFDPTTLGIKTTTNDEGEVNRYSADGRKLFAPSKGINIIKMKAGSVKKVLVK